MSMDFICAASPSNFSSTVAIREVSVGPRPRVLVDLEGGGGGGGGDGEGKDGEGGGGGECGGGSGCAVGPTGSCRRNRLNRAARVDF